MALLPVTFTLCSSDVTALEPPGPFFAMVPRSSYLHCSAADAVAYFTRFSAAAAAADGAGERRVWFEDTLRCESLRWHVPTGVVYDARGAAGVDLPWRITVHFSDYPPSDKFLPCNGDEDVRWKYLNSLKAATFVQDGSSKSVMRLTIAKQAQLWDAVRTGDVTKCSAALAALGGAKELRQVPVRIVVGGELTPLQAPIPARRADGERHTLRSTLALMLPELIVADEEGADPPHGALAAVAQGLRPPLDAPIDLLYEELRHPDMFLYIIVR